MDLRQSQWRGWGPKTHVPVCTHTYIQRRPDMLISTMGYNAFTCTQVNTNNTPIHVSMKSHPCSHLTGMEVHYWHMHGPSWSTGIPTFAHLLILAWALRLSNTHHQILGSVFASVLGWELGLCTCGSPPTHWQVQLQLWIVHPPKHREHKVRWHSES